MDLLSEEEIKRLLATYPTKKVRNFTSDLNKLSLESFLNENAQPIFSTGELRLAGSGIQNNSIDFAVLGKFIVQFQTLVTKLVVTMADNSLTPKQIESASKLSLVTSPAPGSVILKIQSAESTNGLGQLVIPGMDTELDSTFDLLLHLVESAQTDDPELSQLSNTLTSFGASTCASIRRLTGILQDNFVDLEISWRKPLEETKWSFLKVKDSTLIHDLVKRNKLDEEDLELIGIVEGVSRIKTIPLTITTESGELVDLHTHKDFPVTVEGIAVGDSVTVRAKRTETGIGTRVDSSKYSLLQILN